ncbi:MAG: hypothetical protein WC729_30010 [Sphingomonas sp.]|uniref:hypothetical protein n=1 Tax=Sphingomonas sp. TaxID=28214 RepID=UPI0035659442
MDGQSGNRQRGMAFETGFRVVPPSGVLGWLPPQFWRTIKEFYTYGVNFLPIAASGTSTETISIQGSTDFVLLYVAMTATSEDNLTPLAFAPALVQLRDASSGNDLFQTPQHVENVFGTGREPGILAVPYFLRANSALQVTLQNLEAVARNYRLSFIGFRSVPGSDYETGRLR